MTPQEQAAVWRALEGAPYKTIADRLGVAEMTVYRWLNEDYRRTEKLRQKRRQSRNTTNTYKRRIYELERQVMRLEQQLEAWRNVNATQRDGNAQEILPIRLAA